MSKRRWLIGAIVVLAGVLTAVAVDRARAPAPPAKLLQAMEKLRHLHRPVPKPGPGDWLAQHKESGQTFRQYLLSKPVTPTGKRRTLYVQPLGDFTKTQRKIVDLTADFLGRYFQLPVKVAADMPLSVIPANARRVHPSWGVRQILSTYVLDDVLRPKLPDDATAYIAFTAHDLWPGEGWNFVFGQASLSHRVGVWSMARNGDPDESDEAFRLCLSRTIKTAAHETGHMFSIQHCTSYLCCMCGSNSQDESDRQPLELCPECMAKVCFAAQCDPVARFRDLREFCEKQELNEAADFYRQSIAALERTKE